MKCAIGLCLMFLSACVSQNTVLMNDRGQTVNCSNWGFGLIGAPVAYAEHRKCIEKANAAGYHTAPDTQPPKDPPATSHNQNAS